MMVLYVRRPDARARSRLADPEGSEFRVVRSAAERGAMGD